MFAAVDLGSNSFRLHVGEPEGGRMRIVRTARDPIRLAAGLDADGRLDNAAIERALRCLAGFRALLNEYQLDAVRVVATNTMRVATNAGAFLPLAERAIGHPIEIISGEEEGRLIYMGVDRALDMPDERRLVIDIGGGSTELVLGRGHEVLAVESFSIGTHGQGARFFAGGYVTAAGFKAAILAARACFEDAADGYRAHGWNAVYGSSGTMRAIAEVIARNGIGDGAVSLASLKALRNLLVSLGRADRFDLPGIKPERVPVMIGGLSVLLGVMQELGVERLQAINAGLRLGVLSDLELRANRHDRRDDAVAACLGRFGVDTERARRAAALACALQAKLGAPGEPMQKLLGWSAMLHEVGLAVSHSGFHKHGAYIVEHADLPGFTTREQQAMAVLVLGQKGNLRKIRDALTDIEMARAVLALRMAVALLHAHVDAREADALQLRMDARIDIVAPAAWLASHPTLQAWLDKEREAWTEVERPLSLRLA